MSIWEVWFFSHCLPLSYITRGIYVKFENIRFAMDSIGEVFYIHE